MFVEKNYLLLSALNQQLQRNCRRRRSDPETTGNADLDSNASVIFDNPAISHLICQIREQFIMVAVWNTADHSYYIFMLWFVLLSSSSSSFFPRLISAAAHWISAILPHMVWSQCEFKMQV